MDINVEYMLILGDLGTECPSCMFNFFVICSLGSICGDVGVTGGVCLSLVSIALEAPDNGNRHR